MVPRASERGKKKKRGAEQAVRTGLEQTHLPDPNIDASTQTQAPPANLRPPEDRGCKETLKHAFIAQKSVQPRVLLLAASSRIANTNAPEKEQSKKLLHRVKRLLLLLKSISQFYKSKKPNLLFHTDLLHFLFLCHLLFLHPAGEAKDAIRCVASASMVEQGFFPAFSPSCSTLAVPFLLCPPVLHPFIPPSTFLIGGDEQTDVGRTAAAKPSCS